MRVAIALLRGINVGGKRKLPMEGLRALCESLGWTDVATLIASGNVVFRCPERSLAAAPAKLESAIEKKFGFRPGVVIRSADQLRTALKAMPFESSIEPTKLLIMFLAAEPDVAAKKAVAALKPDPERLKLLGREIFLHYPIGVGASKFPFAHVERAVNVPGTTRNLNTVNKLLDMAEALEN